MSVRHPWLNHAKCQQYRISKFDSNKGFVRYGIPTNETKSAVGTWKKALRLPDKEIKEFRDEYNFNKWEERTRMTLEAFGIANVIEDFKTYVPTDRDADKMQMDWFFNILMLKCVSPVARVIVMKHKDTKNTRLIWKELVERFNSSMAAELKLNQLSTYCTSNRYKDGAWRGTQGNYILHFVEQVRIYNELSDGPFTEKQSIRFLSQALMGVPNLEDVYQNTIAARKAAGINAPLKFEEYQQILLNKATVYDNSNTRRPTPRRSVNKAQVSFQDDSESEHEYDYSVNVHELDDDTEMDMDTPLDYLINQAAMSRPQSNFRKFGKYSQGSGGKQKKKVFMDKETWHTLSKDDQTVWDTLTDQAKGSILAYARKKNSMSNNSNERTPTRSVNAAVLVDQEDSPNSNQERGDQEPDVVHRQVNVHNIVDFGNPYHNVYKITRKI